MSFSNFLENEILDQIFGGLAYTAPATVYIALSTADPTDDASGIAEPVGNGYARRSVTNNKTNWSVASGGALANAGALEFGEATGSWGTITHFAIYDALSGGNMLGHGSLTASRAVADGNVIRFDAGELDITLD